MRCAVLALILFAATEATAGSRYSVTVTREEQDLYRVGIGSKLYIKTRYCYEYAYSQDAILVWDGSYNRKLHFLSYDGEVEATCAVEKLLREVEP